MMKKGKEGYHKPKRQLVRMDSREKEGKRIR